MSREFLGRGWSFPVRAKSGQVEMVEDEESVRQSIGIILGTSRGERVMRPDFGCGIHDLVFSTNSPGTAGRIASEVRQALLQWEPRIDVVNIQVESGGDGEVLLISIEYRVRTTNNVFNLVYPFYLNRSAI